MDKRIYTAFIGVSVYARDASDAVIQAFESVLDNMPSNSVMGVYIDGSISEMLEMVIDGLSKDGRVVVVRDSQNGGLSKGINSLIKLSLDYGSDYFFRMDADDVAIPNRFQRQIAFMEDNPKVDVCGSSIIEFADGCFYTPGNELGRRVVPEAHMQIYSGLARTATFNHPTVCFRLASLKKYSPSLKIYDESAGLAEDYKLWVDLAAAGFRFANIKEPLLAFRITDDFYKRRSSVRAFAEHRVRMNAMKRLKLFSISNLLYAYGVLVIRLMPPVVVKIAYKFKRRLDANR